MTNNKEQQKYSIGVDYGVEQHLIKDTKKRTAQRHKAELLTDIAVYIILTLMATGIAFALADVIFGPEVVTEWLAALVM